MACTVPIYSFGYVMSIGIEDQEDKVVEAIAPMLKKYGGVCIVFDAK